MLTQHFSPEVTAGRFRTEAFANGLAQRGHEVHVICPVPNHPRGIIHEGYRGAPVQRRRVGAVSATYVRVLTARKKTFWSRIGYYGSYATMAAAIGAFQRHPDAIIASSPPLPVAAAGALLSARHRAPWLLDIRDLWPQSAVDLGELRPGSMLAAAERLERFVYGNADRIVTANEAFRQWIESRATTEARIEVIPNGTTLEWLEVGEEGVPRSSVGLPDNRFVWAYAGNIGLAHGLEVAADAARLLGQEYLLLVIGDGPRRVNLERRIDQTPAPALDLRSLMPPREAARHLRAADAVLVSERQDRTVSAKLYDVCAVGRPVIAACRGELRRVVEREGIALAVPHGDPEALANAVRRLRSEPELRERLSNRARAFAQRHLRERQAERLALLVESLAGRS
jgi:putative colanic acid biosynthesis glycosyltransferase WcaI